nr:hypothetical protein [Tanacetum cinerariifolium]
TPYDWLKFNNRDFLINSLKEFHNSYKVLLSKEIKGLEALDYAKFSTLEKGRALQALEQFCLGIGRHNVKEKITLKDLFFLHSIDSEEMIDVPWNVAKFLFHKAKGYKKKSITVGAHLIGRIARFYWLMSLSSLRIVILGPGTSLLDIGKLVELNICKYNALGTGELVDDMLDNSKDKADAAEAMRAQVEAGGVRHHPNMSFTNRIRAIDERIGVMDTNIFKLSNDVEELTVVVFEMSE